MFKFRTYIATIFLFALLLPTAIQVIHSFEEHEHVACTSNINKHIHELDNDCGELHLHIKVFYYELYSPSTLLNNKVFAKNTLHKPQQLKTHYFSNKSSRGPPIVII